MRNLILFILLVSSLSSFSQSVTITHTGITPNQGGVQKLTYDQIRQLPNSQAGDLVYDLTFKCLRHFNGTEWLCTNQENSKRPNVNIVKVLRANTFLSTGVTMSRVKVDSSQNVTICGYFVGSVNFGMTTLNALSKDMFIAKYDQNGNEIWVKHIHSSAGSDVEPNGLELDNQGNSYVCGKFGGTIQIGAQTFTSTSIESGFIFKFDSLGNYILGNSITGFQRLNLSGIAIDSYQNFYVCGDFNNSISFGTNNSLISSPSQVNNCFLVKYSNTGDFAWKKQFISSRNLNSILSTNIAGEVYLGINYNADFSYLSSTYLNSGVSNFAILKFSSGSSLLWAEMSTGTGNQNITDIKVSGTSVYVLAKSSSNFSFINRNFTKGNFSSGNSYQIFKFNGFNRGFSWSKVLNASNTGFENELINIDHVGNAYIIGTVFDKLYTSYYSYVPPVEITDLRYPGTSGIFSGKINSTDQDLAKYLLIDGLSNDKLIDAFTTSNSTFLIGETNEYGVHIGNSIIPPDHAFILRIDLP